MECAMADQSRCYTSYLLRLWRPADSGETNWHASLENTQTSECKSFGSLDALLASYKASSAPVSWKHRPHHHARIGKWMRAGNRPFDSVLPG